MTGGGGTKIATPEDMIAPSPEPTFLPGREVEGAKKRARKKPRGREANILAGRMMTQRSTSDTAQILG